MVVPLASALLGAVVGGVVVHRLTGARDARNAQRSSRVDHLISAYRRLVAASNRAQDMTDEQASGLESAIADIVLLGERAEVDQARKFLLRFRDEGGADTGPLLAALRSSLRRELMLEELPMPDPYMLRLGRPPAGASATE
ncbi:MAG: hypothetical protein L6311_06995 [Cellulomonas sp.]|nr:hypothetical protein [Cellulomonas sp.]